LRVFVIIVFLILDVGLREAVGAFEESVGGLVLVVTQVHVVELLHHVVHVGYVPCLVLVFYFVADEVIVEGHGLCVLL